MSRNGAYLRAQGNSSSPTHAARRRSFGATLSTTSSLRHDRKRNEISVGAKSNNTPHSSLPRISGTPQSNCSSSVMVLEETIADVMGMRMQSLTDLGSRIEELSSLHRQEEEAFRKQMSSVLQQAEATRMSQMDTEQDYESLLNRERVERKTVMALTQRFKTQGAEVINTMKEALREAKEKWKREVELNAQLTAQLRQYSMSGKNTSPQSVGGSADEEANGTIRRKIETLTRLLEEEDSIIVELQERNKSLEKKVFVLTQQRNRLLDLEAQQFESEEFNTEYNNLLNQVRDYTTDEGGIPAEVKVEVLTRFTKMLLQRLQTEQRQRLRVEEQAVRMASEHDHLVRALEARIKGIEVQKVTRVPSYRLIDALKDNEEFSDPISEGISISQDQNNKRLPNVYENIPIKKYDVQVLLTSTETTKSVDDSRSKESVSEVLVENVEHIELESQLASVTNDFKQSVAVWNDVISTRDGDGGRPLREEDFYPEE